MRYRLMLLVVQTAEDFVLTIHGLPNILVTVGMTSETLPAHRSISL